jgi:hypothetical protein
MLFIGYLFSLLEEQAIIKRAGKQIKKILMVFQFSIKIFGLSYLIEEWLFFNVEGKKFSDNAKSPGTF